MGVQFIFESLAGYIQFYIDYVLLRIPTEFVRTGLVQPRLVTYFAVGLLLGYLLARMRRMPGGAVFAYSVDSREAGAAPPDDQDLPRLLLISVLVSAVPLHAVVRMIAGDSSGNVSDSINATLAFAATYYPLAGLARAIVGEGSQKTVHRRRRALRYVTQVLMAPLSVAHVFATAAIHRIPVLEALSALLAASLVAVVLVLIAGTGINLLRQRVA